MLRKLAILMTCVGLALAPMSAHALGFGGIKLKSSLNERLDAEVNLLSATSVDIKSLKIKLATDEAFLRAGISRHVFLNNLKFKVKQRSNGDHYIHLTTQNSVREPFLDFLLDINWKNGRMLREYTMLIDPPNLAPNQAMAASSKEIENAEAEVKPEEIKFEEPKAVVEPKLTLAETLLAQEPVYPVKEPEVEQEPVIESVETSVDVVATPEVNDEVKEFVVDNSDREMALDEAAHSSAENAASFETESAFVVDEGNNELWPRIPLTQYSGLGSKEKTAAGDLNYGITKANDNLWNIAEKLRQGNNNVTVYQVMMALLQSNPDAFIDNNVHRLKVGHVLRVNDATMITSLTKKEAANAYIAQTGVWNNYRNKAQASATSNVQPIIASEKINSNSAATTKSKGELTLSSPDGDSLVAGGGSSEENINNDIATLQEQLRQTKSDAGTMRTRNVELNEQLKRLEGKLNRLQRSISVKDDELAALQHQLSTEKPVQKLEIKETSKVTKETAPKVIEKNKPSTPVVIPKTATPPESGIMETVMGIVAVVSGVFAGNSLFLLAPVLLILLLIAIIIIRRNRQDEEFQESILTGSTSVMNNDANAVSEESSFLSDFAMSGASAIETEDSEVDPLTEADVFIAYGRYEAAEERLNEAVQNEPERMDLRAKLLEVHHATQSKDEFESAAEDLYANLSDGDIDNPLWKKVVSMGKEIAPENPLFTQTEITEESTVEDVTELDAGAESLPDNEVMDIGLETGVFDASDMLAETDSSDDKIDFELDLDDATAVDSTTADNKDTADDMDFSLDMSSSTADDELSLDFNLDSKTDDNALDFSLDVDDDNSAEINLGLDEDTLKSDNDNSLDFDLDMSDDKASDDSSNDLSLDLDTDDIASGDEVGTKLDLAKAYIDMGDPEGARSILGEVMDEGSDTQKTEAKELLGQIV